MRRVDAFGEGSVFFSYVPIHLPNVEALHLQLMVQARQIAFIKNLSLFRFY